MGKPTGFLEFDRELPKKRPPSERIQDYRELEPQLDEDRSRKQAARCMDCGTPFCHSGCPLGNIIPEFNDAVYKGDWALAYQILSSTNNFPEFTGRLCPAPCEASCVLGINKPPVAIEFIEKSVIEKAFDLGLVKSDRGAPTGKRVAVVGSGPAGLAAAEQLNKAGHEVVVFEKSDAVGGLLQYGIPDFKLEKEIIDRRINVIKDAGVQFLTNAHVGQNIRVERLLEEYDAILLCGGSQKPRDLPVPGREQKGVHFAMDYLTQQNRRNAGKTVFGEDILASGKNVVVIGGGDTGSDCVGTATRQGAASVTQIEILQKPPLARNESMPWPKWPMILRTSSSHEEGCERHWSILTKAFVGDAGGHLRALRVADIEWKEENSKAGTFSEVPGTEREIPCELALLALGFVHPIHTGMLTDFGVELDERGNVKTTRFQTSVEKVFSAGDMRMGQSLVVWAISEGREAARAVDVYLMGESSLEAKGRGKLRMDAV
jgi:glutamate synthase (NADPH/NADH) small chain